MLKKLKQMSNYLVLNFKNAKLFRNGKDCKDYIFDLNGQRKRAGEPQFVEPITVHQISNLLHVLFGERPVPSNRKALYPKTQYYFDKAMESYIKVEGYKRFNKSKDRYEYVTETLSTKKAVWNSWNPSVQMNWEVVREYVRPENVQWVLDEIKSLLGIDPYSLSFNNIRARLVKLNIEDFLQGLRERQLTGLAQYIQNPNLAVQLTNKLKHTALNINNGIEKVVILRGEILIPVSDEDVEKLRQHKGCATILDGGMVWIKGLVNGDHLSIEGFEKVGEISTEKY
jgi:hypothetical protein